MSYSKNRKKKNSNAYLIIIFILSIIAVIVAIYLVISLSKQNEINNSDVVSQSSSVESVAYIQSSNESKQKEESVINIPSEETKANESKIKQSYEDYIGVEYSIDMNEWEQYICPENEEDYTVLVNKTHPLSKDFVPENMINVLATRKDGRDTQQMVYTAEKALEAFMLEANGYGVTNVTVTSAYRSYSYQEKIFNGYVNNNLSKFSTKEECITYVNTFSAKPGESEHQYGLSCDMHNNPSGADVSFAKTTEAKWLAANAHRFGFILRFPEDKTEITGYQFEPWHFRFVGRTTATEIYQKGLCLEEYLQLKGID